MPTHPSSLEDNKNRAVYIQLAVQKTNIHTLTQQIMQFLFYSPQDARDIQSAREHKHTTNALIQKMQKHTRALHTTRARPNHEVVFRFRGQPRIVDFPPWSDEDMFTSASAYDPMNNVPFYSSDYQIQIFVCKTCHNYQYTHRDFAIYSSSMLSRPALTNHRCKCLVECIDRSMS